jgi:hypothetical protein
MYPGSWADRSKGGVSRSRTRGPRRMRLVRTASSARSAKRVGTAPERTDHETAVRRDVTVNADECNVISVRLSFDLRPSPVP